MLKPIRSSNRINRPKLGSFYPHTHKFVRFIWEEMIRRNLELTSVANAAGIDRSTLYKLKKCQKGPFLVQMEEILFVLGYELKIVKMEKQNGR